MIADQKKIETVLSERGFTIHEGKYRGFLVIPLSPKILSFDSNPFNRESVIPSLSELSQKLLANSANGAEHLQFQVIFTWDNVVYWERFSNRIKLKKGLLSLVS